MNRSWVRFPQAAQIRPPGSGWAFLYACLLLVPRWCSGRRRARLWGRAALCARGRRPAREPSAPRALLGASSRSPARPRHRPRAPQPCPAVAHGHRSLALQSLRRPPHQWCQVADRCVVSKPGQAPPPPINFARNSPAACSSIEFVSLELQRFWGVSKSERDKLRAKFG